MLQHPPSPATCHPPPFVDDPVKIDFTTDKFLASGEADKRELALIVQSIALETKKH